MPSQDNSTQFVFLGIDDCKYDGQTIFSLDNLSVSWPQMTDVERDIILVEVLSKILMIVCYYIIIMISRFDYLLLFRR